MSARSLSRAIASGAAAGALTLALSGTALAMPAGPDQATKFAPPSGNVTSGTDVAAPDQQNPVPPATTPVPQQAPTWPAHPHVLRHTTAIAASTPSSPSSGDDFQWDDAGIGAGGALVVLIAGLGGAMVLRRRRVVDPPLPA
jgi:hypothetical protein